jgi:hypothetical protein
MIGQFLESNRIDSPELAGIWLEVTPENSRRINIAGAFLPDITEMPVYNDIMPEGPYGYRDGEFDVTVKRGDIVIDAGAWIGDFAALALVTGRRHTRLSR